MNRPIFSPIGVLALFLSLGAVLSVGCGSDECELQNKFCIDTGNMNECPTPAEAEPRIRKENPGSSIISVDSVQGPVNGPECCYASSVKGAPGDCDSSFDLTPGF